MRLSQVVQGRDNNFNLIRIAAALTVLVTHSFALSGGAAAGAPGRSRLGMSLGAIAVDVFFATSGFLVTASLMRRGSLRAFVRARVLRIYPANVVMVLLTVFGLGLVFTTRPWTDYLTSTTTLRYLERCATLFFGVSFRLPGVFAHNPYPDAVNGSLWTLPYELHMYALLAFVWFLCTRFASRSAHKAFQYTLVAVTAVSAVLLVLNDLYNPAPRENGFLMLLCTFFSGATCFVMRERIVLSWSLFWPLAALLAASCIDKHLFFAVYLATLAYLVLVLAYLPGGAVRRYNRVGDYSYGTYIYAFPVQQSVAALVPGVSLAPMIALASGATLALAALSWHLIERPALELKEALSRARRPAYGPNA